MGNSLDQYRASIGLNNAGKRSNRKAPDAFWVALKDLLLTLLVLQVLLSGLVALQLHVYHQLGIGVGEEAFIFCPLVGKVITSARSLDYKMIIVMMTAAGV